MDILPTEDASEASPAAAPETLPYAMPADPEASSDRMTRGDVACLTLKVIGLYVIVQSLPMMVTVIQYFHDSFSQVLASAVPFVFTAGLGVALLVWSKPFSKWMLPRTAVVATEPPGHGPAQFQAIAFSMLGVYLCTAAAPALVYLLARIVSDGLTSTSSAPFSGAEARIPSLLHYSVEILLGIWLFFGSKRLSAWWWQLRHPEFQHAPETPEQETVPDETRK